VATPAPLVAEFHEPNDRKPLLSMKAENGVRNNAVLLNPRH
jgi:hypothetical protein